MSKTNYLRKRVLALLLALTMCLSLVQVTAFASEGEEQADAVITDTAEQDTDASAAEEDDENTSNVEETNGDISQEEGSNEDISVKEEPNEDTSDEKGTGEETSKEEEASEDASEEEESDEDVPEEEAPADDTSVCICETKCGEGSVNEDCPVCGADPSACEGPEETVSPAVQAYLDAVEAFLEAFAALTEESTEEEYDAVMTLKEACDEAFDALTPEDLALEAVTEATKKLAAAMEPAETLDTVVATIGETPYETLAAAVAAAQDGDTIVLTKDITESVTVSKSVTFDLNEHTWTGYYFDALTVDLSSGDAEKPPVIVENGTMVSVLYYSSISVVNGDLTVTGCKFEGIRAIYATSDPYMTLNVANCTFDGFVSTLPILESRGNLNITGCSFTDNTLDWAAMISVTGESFSMKDTTLTNNTGDNIVFANAKKVEIKNVTASGNENNGTNSGGGAFTLVGNSDTEIHITSCTFTGNIAKTYGGAIYLNNPGTTIISDTEISDNTANTTGKYAGGGICVTKNSGTVTLTGTTRVFNNHIRANGYTEKTADIALVSGSLKKADAVEEDFLRATLVLDIASRFEVDGVAYTLEKRDVTYSSGKNYFWHVGYCAVEHEPTAVYLGSTDHTASDTVILANTLGEAVEAAKSKGADRIYVCGNIDVTSENVAALNSGIAFVRCMEHRSGPMFTIQGDVTLNGAHINGKKVACNSAMISVPDGSHLTIAGSTVIENGLNTGSGGAISVSGGSLTMEGGTIQNNSAQADGGAVSVRSGSLTMKGGTIQNNSAQADGGAVDVSQGGSLTMTGGAIQNNSAAGNGGGIYALGGGLIDFEGGTIRNNSAAGNGGGAFIAATSGEFGVQEGRTTFDGNTAQMGGGVYLENGASSNPHFYIYKATFTNNTANRKGGSYYDGGAIYIERYTAVHMKNVYVEDNDAGTPETSGTTGYPAVSVCPTGELAVYELEGLLSVNNGRHMDIGTIQGGMYSSIPKVYLPNYVIGGGEVSYTRADGTVLDPSAHQFVEGFFMVRTDAPGSVTSAAKETAEANGVIFTGNYATEYGSAIMTNGILKIGTETKSLKVVKEWSDGNEPHDDDQILVYLTQDGKIVPQDFRRDSTVILNKDNNWSYTWTNLGDGFEWGVAEASVDGYTSKVEIKRDTEFSEIADKYYIATLTNTQEPTPTSNTLSITKRAVDLDPDASYQFTLKLDNVGDNAFAIQVDGALRPIYGNEVTFSLKHGQSAVIEGLPGGFTYELAEAAGSWYETSISESVTGGITDVQVVNRPVPTFGTYQVIHEYYTNGTFDGKTSDTQSGAIGATVKASDIAKVLTYKGGSYTFTSADKNSITLVKDANSNVITLRYDRTTPPSTATASTTSITGTVR